MEQRDISISEQRARGCSLFRSYRKQGNLTQQALASILFVSRSMIAQIEQGDRTPSGKMLEAFSAALHLCDDEEALLFVSFLKLPQKKHIVCVKALILSDDTLSISQAEELIALLTTTYQKYTTDE